MSFDRKKYAREYARKKSAEAIAAVNGDGETCQRSNGGGPCGGPLQLRSRPGIPEQIVCPWCERREAGICRDCDRPVAGTVRRAIRCAECKKRAAYESTASWRRRHKGAVRSQWRRLKRDRARHAARNEYKRQWRKANRDKVREQKRRAALRGRAAEAQRRHRERVAQLEIVRRDPAAPRICLTCDTIMRGRVKKCVICKAREASIAREHPALGRGRGWRNAA